MKIAIVNYGSGNLHSVYKSFQKANTNLNSSWNIEVTNDPKIISKSDKLVLPGVGAIKDCMEALSVDLKQTVLEQMKQKPTLAICVGMQMLLESSEENNGVEGLKILNGKVTKIESSQDVKVPHMGWNQVKYLKDHLLFKNIPDCSFFYFVHSYCCLTSENALTETAHGEGFVSALEKDNILAVQFHPEKSQDVGLELYKNFLNWSI